MNRTACHCWREPRSFSLERDEIQLSLNTALIHAFEFFGSSLEEADYSCLLAAPGFEDLAFKSWRIRSLLEWIPSSLISPSSPRLLLPFPPLKSKAPHERISIYSPGLVSPLPEEEGLPRSKRRCSLLLEWSIPESSSAQVLELWLPLHLHPHPTFPLNQSLISLIALIDETPQLWDCGRRKDGREEGRLSFRSMLIISLYLILNHLGNSHLDLTDLSFPTTYIRSIRRSCEHRRPKVDQWSVFHHSESLSTCSWSATTSFHFLLWLKAKRKENKSKRQIERLGREREGER